MHEHGLPALDALSFPAACPLGLSIKRSRCMLRAQSRTVQGRVLAHVRAPQVEVTFSAVESRMTGCLAEDMSIAAAVPPHPRQQLTLHLVTLTGDGSWDPAVHGCRSSIESCV